jgi:hypothetical protein
MLWAGGSRRVIPSERLVLNLPAFLFLYATESTAVNHLPNNNTGQLLSRPCDACGKWDIYFGLILAILVQILTFKNLLR